MASPLRRRYRRLLLCYPRAYRRARGDELLATLLEAAPPGRTRPTPREAVDLIRHGLRARLGRPASRSVVAWAVLATVISGLFGAAFGTRAGWQTARPLPSAAQTRAMLAEILPGQQFEGIADAPALFVVYGQPLSWAAAGDLLLGDGGEYGQSGVGGVVNGPPARSPQETVELATRRLRETGWTVYAPMHHDTYGCAGPPCDPTAIPQYTTIVARRGDTTFTLEVYPDWPMGSTSIGAGFQRATPAAVYPCGLAGGVAAAAVAFLLFGWASRRTGGRHPARAAVSACLGTTLFFWWVPTLFAVPMVARHHLDEPHPAWHPMWEWLGQPEFSLPFVVGGATALLGLALAALPRRRAATEPSVAPG